MNHLNILRSRGILALTLIAFVFVGHSDSRVRYQFCTVESKINHRNRRIAFLASLSKHFHQPHGAREPKIHECESDHRAKSIAIHNVRRFENIPGNMLQHDYPEHDDDEWQSISKFRASNHRYVRIYAKSVHRSTDADGARRTIQIGRMAAEMSNQTSK